jgi:hypothetical protein
MLSGVQDHEMVQVLSPDRTDQTFGVRILAGALGRGEHFFNVECRNSQTYFVTVNTTTIA